MMNTLLNKVLLRVRSLEPVRNILKSPKEMNSMLILLVYGLSLVKYQSHFVVLVERITSIYIKSGRKFTVLYLKECSRATIQWFAGQTYVPNPEVWIALNKSGLPLIIPGPLRCLIRQIHGGDSTLGVSVLRGVLSIFQFWRVMKVPGSLPKWNTITDPSTAVALPSINEVQLAVGLLPQLKVRKTVEWRISEVSGPNTPIATLGLLLDASAFWLQPKVLLNFLLYLVKGCNWKFILVFIWNLLLGLTILPILLLARFYPLLGKIAKFEEGGGKWRLIGITDQWTQLALRNLHDGIYSVLRLLGDKGIDGTFDQVGPLRGKCFLAGLRPDSTAYSFDLSAATDRLPLSLQISVLEAFGFKGAKEWGSVLTDRWWKSDIGRIKYAVGQPMGAYSSWAMLALTHHVLVQVAARRVGYSYLFTQYVVLGDDIVIFDNNVALAYKQLMLDAGVSINMTKSIISPKGVVEFAKRWIHPLLGEVSPIGASLLLAIKRNVTMYPMLLMEVFTKGVTLFPSSVLTLLEGLNKIRKPKGTILYRRLAFATLGPAFIQKQGHMINDMLTVWIAKSFGFSLDFFTTLVISIGDYWMEEVRKQQSIPRENWEFFWKSFLRTPILPKNKLLSAVLALPMVLSPSWWLYGAALWRSLDAPFSASLNLDFSRAGQPGAISLSALGDFTDLYSIDWTQRGLVSKHTIALGRLADRLDLQMKLELMGGTSIVPYTPKTYAIAVRG